MDKSINIEAAKKLVEKYRSIINERADYIENLINEISDN